MTKEKQRLLDQNDSKAINQEKATVNPPDDITNRRESSRIPHAAARRSITPVTCIRTNWKRCTMRNKRG